MQLGGINPNENAFATKAGVFDLTNRSVLGNVVANIHSNYFVAGFNSAIDYFPSNPPTVSNVVSAIGADILKWPTAIPTQVYLGRDIDFPRDIKPDNNWLDRDKDGIHNGTAFTDMKKTGPAQMSGTRAERGPH